MTITGRNFAPGCEVRFGGNPAQVLVNSPTQLTVLTPAATSVGPVNIRIINAPQQAGVAENAFIYTEPSSLPIVLLVSPTSGPVSGGTQVTITGQNFGPNCEVRFGGNSAQILFRSPTQLNVITPAGAAAGPVNLRIVNSPQEAGVAQNAFVYVDAPPPPPTQTTVNVTAPAGGEALRAGQTLTVRWGTSGPVASHVVRCLEHNSDAMRLWQLGEEGKIVLPGKSNVIRNRSGGYD